MVRSYLVISLLTKLLALSYLVNMEVARNAGIWNDHAYFDRKAGGVTEQLRTMADLAALLGVKTATIRHYRADSLPGGRYENHPFPEPDGHLGSTPYWLRDRDDQIRAWAAARPGKGVGGGKPAHRASRARPEASDE